MNSITKKCSKCGQAKLASEFYKNSNKKDGLASYCKSCDKVNSKKWYLKNTEKIKKRHLEQYCENKDTFKERISKYYQNNKEKILDYSKKWRKENVDYKSKRYEKVLQENRNRRARVLGNGGEISIMEWNQLKENNNFSCLCCKRSEPEIKLTLDHIVPLLFGGTNTIDNAQPLCRSCNSRKGAKHIDYRK